MIVTDEICDAAMGAILDYFSKFGETHHIDKSYLVYMNICKESDAQHIIDVLVGKKLIEYGSSYQNDDPEIRLTDAGRMYFEARETEKRREEKEEKATRSETRRFWFSLIKDILIFLVGLFLEYRFSIVQFIASKMS